MHYKLTAAPLKLYKVVPCIAVNNEVLEDITETSEVHIVLHKAESCHTAIPKYICEQCVWFLLPAQHILLTAVACC